VDSGSVTFPNLLTYSDYRQYLRDYYEINKAANPDFSFRYLSQRAGVNSSAYFKYVIEGKRNLTKGSLLKTCIALNLKDRDAEYFENLVFFNQAKTLREKNIYFERLTKLKGLFDTRRVRQDQYAFYSEWYHSAVREMLGCIRFKGDYDDLAARMVPSITAKQARDSVALLLRLGLVRKDAQGIWQPTDPVLTTDGQVTAKDVSDFQLRMLLLASEAFGRFTAEERLMSSTTFSISAKALDLFKRKIRVLKSELLELARLDDEADRVFQLNLNLFPLTVAGSEGKTGKSGKKAKGGAA
jgi:uncharacterized protein (TIGR02147 family)